MLQRYPHGNVNTGTEHTRKNKSKRKENDTVSSSMQYVEIVQVSILELESSH